MFLDIKYVLEVNIMGKECDYNKTAFTKKEVNKRKFQSLVIIVLIICIQFYMSQNIDSIYSDKAIPIENIKNSNYSINPMSDLSINQITMKRFEAIRLSANDNEGSFLPEIAIDSSGNVHVVWQDESTPNDEIFYRKYLNNKDYWSDIEILSNTTESRISNFPVIKIDTNDVIHVLWRESGFFINSTLNYRYYNGTVWSDIEIVAQITDVTLAHDLISNNNSTFVIWNNKSSFNKYELYYKIYKQENDSWSSTTQLTNNNFTSISPKIVLDSQQLIHLIWTDSAAMGNISEVQYQYFINNNWFPQEPIIVSTVDYIPSHRPSIQVDGENVVHVIWEDMKDGVSEILYRTINSNGLGEEKTISGENQSGLYPASCRDEFGNIHIIWYENNYIYYKQIGQGGILSDICSLTNEQSILIFPKITESDSTLHIVWNDYQKDGSWEIYYLKVKLLGNRLLLTILFLTFAVFSGSFIFVTIFIIVKKKVKRNTRANQT